MSSENYQLYKKHKHEIFDMIFDTVVTAGLEENPEEYLQRRSAEFEEYLIEKGFKLKE